MKKRTLIFIILLALLMAGLLICPAFCRRVEHKGLYLVNKNQGQKNLVVVTHGWIHKGKGQWPQKMAEAINKKTDSVQWLICYFDWGKGSATIDPVDAVTYARDIAGSAMAGQILKLKTDFDHIHLIGHSCGAWVVNEAAKILSGQMNADIHLTLLDAYVPKDWQQELLGDINTPVDVNIWAEHYYTKDLVTSKVTEYNLRHAHNVDITAVDQKIKDHNFPWKWYHATITGKFPKWSFMDNDKLVTEANGTEYGFACSKEASNKNWQNSLTLKMGNEAVKINAAK